MIEITNYQIEILVFQSDRCQNGYFSGFLASFGDNFWNKPQYLAWNLKKTIKWSWSTIWEQKYYNKDWIQIQLMYTNGQ